MTKSKEEILDGWLGDTIEYPHYEMNGFQRRAAISSMDEYAKSQAISFGQWATLNDYTYLKSKDYWVNEEEEENNKKYSNDELYNLFLQDQNKKQ